MTIVKNSHAQRLEDALENILGLIEVASAGTVNSVEVTYSPPKPSPAGGGISICEIVQELEVAPTSSLWCKSSDLPRHLSPSEDLAAANLKSKEGFVSFNGISRMPTCLRTIITIEIPAPSEEIIDVYAELVAGCISDDLIELSVFGGDAVKTSRVMRVSLPHSTRPVTGQYSCPESLL